MAPVVWPDGMGIPQSNPTHSIRGTLWTGSYSFREIVGSTALDVGVGLLFGAECC